MEEQPPKYRSEFLRSPHHAVFALLTVGAGFISADLLPLIVGGTLYTLGWIYLPDMKFFRGWVDRRRERARQAEELQRVAEFVKRREGLLESLSSSRKQRYFNLVNVCRDIEVASSDSPLTAASAGSDPRLRKLDELMWTYLRLLSVEESLERFLETERNEDLPRLLKEAEAEISALNADVETLKAKGPSSALETRQRYLTSRLERREVLRKRHERMEQAHGSLALVISEQERLDQQIKLLRADAIATKNADSLTAKIDATVEHLDQTNKWISELSEFKDIVGDMPHTEMRVGYEAVAPPPVIEPAARQRQAVRVKGKA